MEQTPRRRSFSERLAGRLALPADAIAGVPRIELVGDQLLRVERHRGILAYDPGEVHIGGGKLTVRVRGFDLELGSMDRQELVITGRIVSVELE